MAKLKKFKDLEKDFDRDINHLCYYMRGSLSREEAWMLSRAEAMNCSEFIKETRKEEINFAVKTSSWGLLR